MRKIAILAMLSLAFMAKAQQPWTLRQCIDYAVANNISIQQHELSRQQRELDVNIAKYSRLPDLNASASENLSFGRGLTADNTYTNTNTQSTSLSLSTTVPVFTGFRLPKSLKLSKLILEAANADLEKVKSDVSMQVAQLYVQILYNMELCDVANRQVEIDSMQVFRVEQLLNNGKASGMELAQQQATLSQSKLTATQADNDRRLSLLSLAQLLELPAAQDFEVQRIPLTAFEVEVLPSPDAIFSDALTCKPEIRAEQLRLEGAEKNIGIARSAYFPTVYLQAGLGSNYYKTNGFAADGFMKQLKNNFGQFIGLSVNISIFNRFETRNNVRSAKLSYTQQQLQLEQTKKNLYKEIQQAYFNGVASQAKYESSRQAVNSQQAAFQLMTAMYENGKANITEFNETKNNLMRAESDFARAKYEYLYQRAVLDFYRGKPLHF